MFSFITHISPLLHYVSTSHCARRSSQLFPPTHTSPSWLLVNGHVCRARIKCVGETSRSTAEEGEKHTAILRRSDIPSHFRIPYIGLFIDNWILNKSNLDLARKYGPIYRTDLVGVRVLVISDPLAITKCLKDTSTFQSSGAFLFMVEKLFGKHLMFMSDGKDHARKRARVMPAFTMQMISGYFNKIEHAAFYLWEQVEASIKEGVPSSLENLIGSHYIRIVVAITTGSSFRDQAGESTEIGLKLSSYLRDLFHGSNSPPFGPIWDRAKHAKMEIRRILRKLICESLEKDKDLIDAIREGNINMQIMIKENRINLLIALIAASELRTGRTRTRDVDANKNGDESGDNVELIAALVMEIWFGGFFSTTSTTFSSLMEMEMDSGILHALREEQASISELTAHSVTNDMPLLSSFVLEVLRMHPPAFIWFRKTSKPTVLLNYSIPENERLILDLWSAQRDPNYFSNPDQFTFRRFLPTSSTPPASSPASMLLSFGAVGGAHYCIGASLAKLSIKTTLAVLLRHYDLKLVPRKTSEYQTIPEFKPKDGIKAVHCRRRRVPTHSKTG